MKKIKPTFLITFFILSVTTFSNAQYKLNIGNLWLYVWEEGTEGKISIIDTVTLFDSLLYYEYDGKGQSSGNYDRARRYFIRKKEDGLFERVITYPNSDIEIQPYTYKENAQLGDKWVYYLHYENDSTEVDTVWGKVEDVFMGLQFGEWITIKKVHYYSDNPQIITDYYKYFNEEFGELAEEGYLYFKYLVGCYIDGVLYGDTTFTINSIGKIENYTKTYRLEQNYPNPFNSSTTILYTIPMSGNVKIIVHDITGREVAVLTDEYHYSGNYKISFNASEFKALASGIYYYQIISNLYNETKKMIYLR